MSKHLLLIVLLLVCSHTLSKEDSEDSIMSEKFEVRVVQLEKVKHLVISIDTDLLTQVEASTRTFFIGLEAVKGLATVALTGFDPRSNYEGRSAHVSSQSVVERPEIFAITKDSAIWTDLKATGKLVVTLSKLGEAADPEASVRVTAVCSSSLYAPIGFRYLVHVEHLTKLTVSTRTTKKKGNHHYKFLFESAEKSHQALIQAEGRKLDSDASSSNQPAFRFLRFHQDRVGYVIDPADPLYCAANCEYRVHLTLSKVKVLQIYLGEHVDFEMLEGKDHSVVATQPDRADQGRLRKDQQLQVPGRLAADPSLHADPD